MFDRARSRGAGELKRRGVMAGIAGLAVAAVAKLAAQPASAANGQPLVLGADNQSMAATTWEIDLSSGTVPGFSVTNSFGTALMASTMGGTGLAGVSIAGIGVLASGGGVGGIGLSAGGAFAGVSATGGMTGVSGSGQVGVSGGGGSMGVLGESGSFGVAGLSQNGQGVNGQSQTFIGVVGTSQGRQPGVYGSSASGAGVFGTTGDTASGLAAYFVGPTIVEGDFTVLGGAKSAAVTFPDGSVRRFYSVESPESYFEDFGAGRLVGGRTTIAVAEDFAVVVHSDDYQVFLTAEGDSNGLYVAGKTPLGFEVHEQHGGTSNISFAYRVVARRKDIAARRMDHVHKPQRPGPVEKVTPPTLTTTPPPTPG